MKWRTETRDLPAYTSLEAYDVPLAFLTMNNVATENGPARSITRFAPTRRSIATQVNRDIALVLDRSSSMIRFGDEDLLAATLDALESTKRQVDRYNLSSDPNSPDYDRIQWIERGLPVPAGYRGPSRTRNWSYISATERDDGKANLARRKFSDNVIYQLERFNNPNNTLGLRYSEDIQNDPSDADHYDPDDDQRSTGDRNDLTQPMAIYARDFDNAYLPGDINFPRFSRWDYLNNGVDAFLDVLNLTDQEELVSLVTFSDDAQLELNLQDSTDDDGQAPPFTGGYPNVRRFLSGIEPDGKTAIGDGLLAGLPPLIPNEDDPNSRARPFAARTIIVLTDGNNNRGVDPGQAVRQVVDDHDITIHTVTFTPGADQAAMQAVADAGHGRHYHDDNGTMLVAIFEEIANNLPTVLTE